MGPERSLEGGPALQPQHVRDARDGVADGEAVGDHLVGVLGTGVLERTIERLDELEDRDVGEPLRPLDRGPLHPHLPREDGPLQDVALAELLAGGLVLLVLEQAPHELGAGSTPASSTPAASSATSVRGRSSFDFISMSCAAICRNSPAMSMSSSRRASSAAR